MYCFVKMTTSMYKEEQSILGIASDVLFRQNDNIDVQRITNSRSLL